MLYKKQDLLSHPGVNSLIGYKQIIFINRISALIVFDPQWERGRRWFEAWVGASLGKENGRSLAIVLFRTIALHFLFPEKITKIFF